jgi:hypothetical protein
MKEGNPMNLQEVCTQNEIQLLNDAGIKIENKDYTNDDLKKCQSQIADFIMSHSSKNGAIDKMANKYNNILRTIDIN